MIRHQYYEKLEYIITLQMKLNQLISIFVSKFWTLVCAAESNSVTTSLSIVYKIFKIRTSRQDENSSEQLKLYFVKFSLQKVEMKVMYTLCFYGVATQKCSYFPSSSPRYLYCSRNSIYVVEVAEICKKL
jgi:hypothetical protein